MSELLPLSVGIGLAISLLMSEAFGVATGGLIVPGYFALSLTHPLTILATLVAGLGTYAIVRSMSLVLIIYGRRRTTLMILVGYLLGAAMRWMLVQSGQDGEELKIIGYVIPGLLAMWLDRQGVVETICSLLTASVLVRMVLVLLVGRELSP